MLGHKYLKGTVLVTLFFFMFFIFAVDYVSAQHEDDVLLKARRLYQQGDYEGSIKILGDFISKLKAMVEQKRNVAEAFYLLAKIYYEVGDDTKVDENLTKCFKTFPAFTMEEANLGFKSRVDQIKKEVLEAKTRQPLPEAEEFEEPEEQNIDQERVIQQPTPVKKKKKFPVLLVVGGAIVVGVILALALGGKDKKEDVYDIRGDWTVLINLEGTDIPFYMTFSGSINNGTFVDQDGDTGTYTVNGRSVNFQYDFFTLSFNGSFSGQNSMSGTYDSAVGTSSWRATRGFSSAITYEAASFKTQCNKNR